MPFALPILGGIGAGVAGFFGVTLLATSLTAILIGGVIVVGAALLTRKMMNQRPSDPGMLINKNSSNDPITVVYGQRRVGATRTFIRSAGATGGAGHEYLHIVFTICEGPIEAIDKIYFNDLEVWDRVTGISTSAGEDNINFTGLIEINNHLGSTTETADANLVARFPAEWTSNHRGRGIAYSYIRFKYNRDAFAGLPTVTFLVRGRKVRDVDNVSAAEAYSINPANTLYDYLTHATYGRGFPASLIDIASFQDAKDYYNLTHTYLGAAKYTINGALATDDNTYDNVQKILAACNSALIFSNGVYKLIPFKAANSIDTITDSHIVDSWNMSFGDKTKRFNTIRGGFPDMTDDYQQGTVTVQNSAFKTADRNLLLKKDVSLDFVVDPARAKLLAYELLLQSRYQTTIELTLPHTKQILEPMDVITFEHSQITDEVPTLYRVLDIQLRSDGTVKIIAQEYNGAVYTEIDPDTL
jgi:hypothetical protein